MTLDQERTSFIVSNRLEKTDPSEIERTYNIRKQSVHEN